MNWMLAKIIGGVVVAALVIALGMAVKANGAKGEEVRELKRDLASASLSLEQASRDIARFSVKESAVAAEAAKLCALEGDGAFARGVEVGIAVCEARK